jgi:ubiquinone/menaquinone biosynthesis C-methylase UbiE
MLRLSMMDDSARPSQDQSSNVRVAYDTVARDYDAQFARELDAKPLDRALLTAFVELVGAGVIADVGCGPGHVTRFLASGGADVLGVDLSPAMIDIARERAPELAFTVGSMLELPVRDGAWAAAVVLYSIIHLDDDERRRAFHELARAIRPNGRMLVSFHVDTAEVRAGEVAHVTEFLGRPVTLDGYFLDPGEVEGALADAGFRTTATIVRAPIPDIEYPSRRCYLLAQRT